MAGLTSPRALRRSVGSLCAIALLAVSAASPGLAEVSPAARILAAGELAAPALTSQYANADALPEQSASEPLGTGIASWYGPKFAGRRTASGETFDPSDFTAAHRTLPFGSRVKVTYIASGRSVIVRINDRGPFARGRVIDLSQAAARELGITGTGQGEVSLELLAS